MEKQLLDTFDDVFEKAWSETQEGKIASLKYELPLLNGLAWLSHQSYQQHYFWKSRNDDMSRAGIGQLFGFSGQKESEYSEALAEMTSLSRANDCQFFGGSSFSLTENKEGSVWKDLPYFTFLIPDIELISDSHKSILYINFVKGKRKANEKLLREKLSIVVLQDTFSNERDSNQLVQSSTEMPDFERWTDMVAELKDAFSHSEMTKSVLARQVKQEFKKMPCPYYTCYKHAVKNKNSFTFLMKFDQEHVFFGHSPEMLCHINDDREITTEALAGTMKRGDSPSQEKNIEKALLSKKKEIEEQGIVLEYLKKRLHYLCKFIEEPTPLEVIKIANVQHLYQSLSGILKNNILLLDLLNELHPTPAVCGEPKLPAKAFINRVEPFSRGWYAGFIGLFSETEIDIAVSIRSVLQTKNARYLFSGAGILTQSDPKAEWDELDHKIASYL